MNWITGIVVALVLVAGGYYFITAPDDAMMEQDSTMEQGEVMEGTMTEKVEDAMMEEENSMMKEEDTMMEKKGSYQDYSADKLALASEGKVVLYFHADWCPICRPLDAEFRAKESVLSGVHILKVNYDTATALRQKYGVTYQHTFVQVDAAGNLIVKWGDARSLADVLARVQ